MTSDKEKKRRRPLSSPGMIDVLRTLTALVSNFSEVDSSKLHAGYVCRSCDNRLQTVIKNLQSALPVLPKVQVDENEAEALLQFPSTDATSPERQYIQESSSPALTVSFVQYNKVY